MADLLNKIIAHKRGEVQRRMAAVSLQEIRADAADAAAPRGFVRALEQARAQDRPGIIAEIKKASPSRGLLRADFDAATLAENFAAHDATCLSVLTDENYFHGGAADLVAARAACELPVLRKDFIVGPYQVFESRALGADAILLICAALDDATLRELIALADEVNLDVLVETHTAEEFARALELPCKLIGVNNRDLRTFETKLETTLELLARPPRNATLTERIIVTESGVHTRADVTRLRRHGAGAFLVGEALMRAENPGAQLQTMFAAE